MESNRKRKHREKEPSEERQSYYKRLRKEQKKKRKKSKNRLQEEIARNESSVARRTRIDPPRATKEENSEKFLPRGKRMVLASLQKKREKHMPSKKKGEKNAGSQKKTTESSRREMLVPASTKTVQSPIFKELSPENLLRDKGGRSIGCGTFGNCYPGTYRGISVVIKEYKERSNARDRSHSLSLLQREAKHKARVLHQLGDHPGIPLLFGVSLKEIPVSIVLKFHGDSGESLTVFKAPKNNNVSEQKDWNRILHDTAGALEHVHKCGFAHNDLKANNVVLEKRQDQLHHPVIIDFGQSVAFSKAKNPHPKPSHLKEHYKNSYIAPELVDGSGKPSVESDVYSLAFMIETVYRILKFENIVLIKNGLSALAANRPSISEIKAALCAAF